MLKPFAVLIAATALVSGCMSATDLTSIEAAVRQFHDLQARGDDAAIYQAASPEFRNTARESDLVRLDAALRGLQGCTAPARDPNQWNNNINTSGHYITVVYNRQCAGGPLVETFVFRVAGAQTALMSYNASGMALFPSAPAQSPPATDTSAPPPEKPTAP